MKWLQPIQQLDIHLFRWCMARRRRELLTALSRSISKTADGWLYLVFIIAYSLIPPQDNREYVMLFFSAFAIERVLYLVLKNSCRRNRPQEAIDDFQSFIVPSDKFSFPSGHTSAAFLFTVLASSQFPALLPVLLCWASMVGLSRVFLGVHFPTDTLVGAALGTGVALGLLSLGGL